MGRSGCVGEGTGIAGRCFAKNFRPERCVDGAPLSDEIGQRLRKVFARQHGIDTKRSRRFSARMESGPYIRCSRRWFNGCRKIVVFRVRPSITAIARGSTTPVR